MISTYPFGSAALQWLSEHRGFSTLMVTYIPAFHVHPLWVYPGVDLHFVMYDTAGEHARMAGFERTMRLGAPPVRRGFGDFSRAQAREMLGLPRGRFHRPDDRWRVGPGGHRSRGRGLGEAGAAGPRRRRLWQERQP